MWKWLVILFWSGASMAAHPDFLLPFIGGNSVWPDQKQFLQTGEWLECSDNIFIPSWCGDEFSYYTLPVWPEVKGNKEGGVHSLTLHGEYSPNSWSLFQLNLRKDGFQLQSIQLGEQQFSIAEQLKTATTQEVDKALVLFLNRYAQSFPKALTWQKEHIQALLATEGKETQLQFTRLE